MTIEKVMFYIPIIQAGLAVLVTAVAAYTDRKTGLIPNKLCFCGIGSGILLGLLGGNVYGLALAFAGAFVAGLIPLIMFRVNAMGGGDVKLFFAVGALLGISAALEIQMMSFIFGALWGIGFWIKKRQLITGLKGVLVYAMPPVLKKRVVQQDKNLPKTEIKFAPAIFAAVLLVVVRSTVELI